jgi:hypothetical protein
VVIPRPVFVPSPSPAVVQSPAPQPTIVHVQTGPTQQDIQRQQDIARLERIQMEQRELNLEQQRQQAARELEQHERELKQREGEIQRKEAELAALRSAPVVVAPVPPTQLVQNVQGQNTPKPSTVSVPTPVKADVAKPTSPPADEKQVQPGQKEPQKEAETSDEGGEEKSVESDEEASQPVAESVPSQQRTATMSGFDMTSFMSQINRFKF